mgnify:CR=1 FL=1
MRPGADPLHHAAQLGEELEHRGFALNFRSSHLLARNWIQLLLKSVPRRVLVGNAGIGISVEGTRESTDGLRAVVEEGED